MILCMNSEKLHTSAFQHSVTWIEKDNKAHWIARGSNSAHRSSWLVSLMAGSSLAHFSVKPSLNRAINKLSSSTSQGSIFLNNPTINALYLRNKLAHKLKAPMTTVRLVQGYSPNAIVLVYWLWLYASSLNIGTIMLNVSILSFDCLVACLKTVFFSSWWCVPRGNTASQFS